MNFHFLVQIGGDISGTVTVIYLHVGKQAHANVGAHVPKLSQALVMLILSGFVSGHSTYVRAWPR